MMWLRSPSAMRRVGRATSAVGLVIMLVGLAGSLLTGDSGTPIAASSTVTTTSRSDLDGTYNDD